MGNGPVRTDKPKNIILLIGDGMGLTQISAGMYANGNSLNLEKMPVTGLMTTYSYNKLITDSAAGATAFACGCKTRNGALGMTADKKPCRTILEQAQSFNMACGLVATCSVTHATPAAFVAHVQERADKEAIATYFVEKPLDLFIGGGLQFFENRKLDQRNIRRELEGKGCLIYDYRDKKLSEVPFDPAHPVAWFSAMDEPDHILNGRDYLPLAARIAPDFLKKRANGKGFFMMLEGSQIDWACHANDGKRAIAEMLDFDAAIGEILRFAERDGETLVVVTADHETGGMAIEQGSNLDSLALDFTSTYHSASMIPVFAYGPGSKSFSGIYDNTDIYKKMIAALQW
ncbi:MAG: alkaline phosphatase [Saprospiraceae bacterium]|nr:alkaline phosphatase [Saprospiraceae bacterium]